MYLQNEDPKLYKSLIKESVRQDEHIELIASENFVSKAVLEAQGSILTNKYAEGYPGNRYYGGCEFVDEIERLAIERLKQLFNAKYVNVQPHSGSQANASVYHALVNPGDTVLGMSLDAGGHLTHGYKLSFSGRFYKAYAYGVSKTDECIDYEEVLRIAKEVNPKMIIAGASAYARTIDFKRFREIADEVGAYLFVDMAHIAGLVAAGVHPSPLPYAHVVTSTTHKTLRGPRGGIILTNDEEVAKKINKAVFPGEQGGPLMHVIAAKAVAFKEALDPSFVEYQKQVVKNAKVMADTFKALGYRVVSGTTDNHLVLIDVKSKLGITGKLAEETLYKVNITINKNAIPFDQEKPAHTSGIRLGSPAMTTKGFKEKEFKLISEWIHEALTHTSNEEVLQDIRRRVIELTKQFKNN
ncbi:serine hydroxymethyltransferase [Acholeplasma hippikon]|uniref:Serine hydroxymethyltransferase n=1 Tax=Acholeplasma hippikon TaxID=264636 RepID=A0A449BKP8_9MOLU|nr:serine hydroxymethyltransferase [Acholeplasma hippikon]VEU83002.1 serine hydroxymethyltransferase [Acholeplasma hippikon]